MVKVMFLLALMSFAHAEELHPAKLHRENKACYGAERALLSLKGVGYVGIRSQCQVSYLGSKTYSVVACAGVKVRSVCGGFGSHKGCKGSTLAEVECMGYTVKMKMGKCVSAVVDEALTKKFNEENKDID